MTRSVEIEKGEVACEEEDWRGQPKWRRVSQYLPGSDGAKQVTTLVDTKVHRE